MYYIFQNYMIYTKIIPFLKKYYFWIKTIQRSWRFLVGHLLSEDDHSHWAPPYWNVTKETFSLGRTEL